ncbi:MAG: hypothetical protein Q8K60_00715 [Parachlamydiaceae bacterium]|nr:hypothetical protein [Parachlamydiaceae bacterium]
MGMLENNNSYEYIIYTNDFQKDYFEFWKKATKEFPIEVQDFNTFCSFDQYILQEKSKKLFLRLLCVTQGKIIGTLEFTYYDKNIIEAHYFYILPEWRGIGIEMAFEGLQRCINKLKNKNSVIIKTNTWEKNKTFLIWLNRILRFSYIENNELAHFIFPLYGCSFFKNFLTKHHLWKFNKLLSFTTIKKSKNNIKIIINLKEEILLCNIVFNEKEIIYHFNNGIFYFYKYINKKDSYERIISEKNLELSISSNTRKIAVLYKGKPIFIQYLDIVTNYFEYYDKNNSDFFVNYTVNKNICLIRIKLENFTIIKLIKFSLGKLLVDTFFYNCNFEIDILSESQIHKGTILSLLSINNKTIINCFIENINYQYSILSSFFCSVQTNSNIIKTLLKIPCNTKLICIKKETIEVLRG